MSSRRSLYRTNRSHTSLYGPRTDTAVTHWQLDYVTINTTRDEEAPADSPQKTNSFQVKTWVQVPGDAFKALDDGVEGDALPFTKHAHAEGDLGLAGGRDASEAPSETAPKSDTNGLTSVLADSSRATGPELADVTPAVTPAVETPAGGTSEGSENERASMDISGAETGVVPVAAESADAQTSADARSAPSTSAAAEESASATSASAASADPAPSAPADGTAQDEATAPAKSEAVKEAEASAGADGEPPLISASDVADAVKPDSDVAMPDAE